MTRRYRILGIVSILLAVALVSFALALSYDAPCGAPDSLPADAQRMKAVTYRCYGSPDVLRLEELAKPTVADDQILVKVHAAAVNPIDWHYMTGTPYIMRMSSGLGAPDSPRVGVDFAGTIEAVGKNVRRFKPGDEVFGSRGGALAEYVTVREDRAVALKPSRLTFEQAAAVPLAAITALQGLRDKGRIQPGQKVLINGASGGVGTFAVQLAKAFGAEVTGVCSTRNVELVRSLGADHVIDYTREDFSEREHYYDVILDTGGHSSLSRLRLALTRKGTLVIVGAETKGKWFGGFDRSIRAMLLSRFISQQLVAFVNSENAEDLIAIKELIEAGKITPTVDRTFSLGEAPKAISYLAEGHARGKVAITV